MTCGTRLEGAAARRAERLTRVLGTIRPDPGSSWSPRRPPTPTGPSQLAATGRPGRSGGRVPGGLWVRAVQRLLAINAAIWFGGQIGAPSNA